MRTSLASIDEHKVSTETKKQFKFGFVVVWAWASSWDLLSDENESDYESLSSQA
jgi:hypothetical protein